MCCMSKVRVTGREKDRHAPRRGPVRVMNGLADRTDGAAARPPIRGTTRTNGAAEMGPATDIQEQMLAQKERTLAAVSQGS
jgi:hypothetical protein